MEFHETMAGKKFFESQLPCLITTLTDIAAVLKNPTPIFQLEQKVSPDFLKDLYYGAHDLQESANSDALRSCNSDIIAYQEQMRKELTPDTWEYFEQYKSLLDARGTVEREQAFETGFQYAARLLAAGLSVPQDKAVPNGR